MSLYSGKKERLPYSLSRWTDLPTAKWSWFKGQLDQGKMRAFDPRNAIPVEWSLDPSDTLGLIFWTKDPENLIRDRALLEPYKHKLVVHMTLTGWEEVERGAPTAAEGIKLMEQAIKAFGPENLTWRFSPVPLVDNVLDRFESLASKIASFGLKEVYVSFLQENDLMPETRARRTRVELLKQMATRASGLQVLLCNEDQSLQDESCYPRNLQNGICESGRRFAPNGIMNFVSAEGCGCALAVDPFTINESCTLGCTYCYAADKTLTPKKRNTTKFSLPLVSSS